MSVPGLWGPRCLFPPGSACCRSLPTASCQGSGWALSPERSGREAGGAPGQRLVWVSSLGRGACSGSASCFPCLLGSLESGTSLGLSVLRCKMGLLLLTSCGADYLQSAGAGAVLSQGQCCYLLHVFPSPWQRPDTPCLPPYL